jgi:mannose-6-phosphate isomerase-like protein (cupin superfamily)
MSGKMFQIHKDMEWKVDPPKHTKTAAYPLVNPKTCPGAQFEFHITEISPGGVAADDVHPDEDHMFWCFSGRAKATVDGEEFLVEPGCALWVPKGAVHSFDPIYGGEVFRIGVIFAPPRDIWG